MAYPLLSAGAAVVGLLALYLWRINLSWKHVPNEERLSPWTTEQMHEAYERIKKNRIDFSNLLPPRLDRRYMVVGGSGLVGGDIVLQLLARGQSPESIRIVDFSPLSRKKMLRNGAGACDYVKTDVSSSASVETAFAKPWPASVADKPLTVFHTVGRIAVGERKWIFYDRLRQVNVVGAANVLDRARKAGADILVATASASIAIKPVDVWGWPWQKSPKNHVQYYNEDDFDKPLRPHNEFFSNYAYAKAEAERLICGANSETFRTGVIRPGNAIYGDPADLLPGMTLSMAKEGPVSSWTPHIIQNSVASRNVSLAHLLFEAALLAAPSKLPICAGRTYNITDPSPSGIIQLGYIYKLCQTLTTSHPVVMTYPAPVILFIIAQVIEKWCIFLYYLPEWLKTPLGWKEPSGLIHNMQPAVFSPTSHTICDDSRARKSVEDGGLGYQSGCETFEAMVELLVECNEYDEEERLQGKGEPNGTVRKTATEKIKAAVVPRPEPVGA